MTCNNCGKRTDLFLCDPCHASQIRSLLSSSAWLATRGVTAGDFPGETMADTMRRELAALVK